MVLTSQGPIENRPLKLFTDIPIPSPGPKEILIKINACAVCRTDLHIIEGDLPGTAGIIPGHQIVGMVAELGKEVSLFKIGDRVGLGWVYSACGICEFCHFDRENLCDQSLYTGWTVGGGFSEFCLGREEFCIPLNDADAGKKSAEEMAPLLCAGILGFRALSLACEGHNVKRVGLFGFGSSAHLAIQVAIYQGKEVSVMARGEKSRAMALALGASHVSSLDNDFPHKVDAGVVFAPVGEIVPRSLENLQKGGTLSLAGIHMSDIPALNYERHLFYEKRLQSVTSFTRKDAQEYMKLAIKIPVNSKTKIYPLESANEALWDLKYGKIQGTAVLKI